MTFLLHFVIVSSFILGSASNECPGGDSSSVVVVPSSGPTVCLPIDDYIQLQQQEAQAVSDGETADASPASVQSVSSSALILYRYMSPLWLNTHANFTETASSVSAQTIEFGMGSTLYGVLFRVKLIEAGVLDDDKAYAIQIGFFFTHPGDSDPYLHICDGSYCVGFHYAQPNFAYPTSAATDSVGHCNNRWISSRQITAPQSPTHNWNIRFEINPNSTSGITYVSTSSLTHEFSMKLKPSQGLDFRVCRDDASETYEFHLFELAVYSNE